MEALGEMLTQVDWPDVLDGVADLAAAFNAGGGDAGAGDGGGGDGGGGGGGE